MTDAGSSSSTSTRRRSFRISQNSAAPVDVPDDLDLAPPLKKRRLELSSPDIVLDARVWSGLPDDAIERVLSWLPIRNLVRCRSVCKKWNSIITHPSFLRLLSGSPNQGPWFVFFLGDDYEMASAFDPTSNGWYPLAFPSFPGASQGPVASHGGLVCFMVEMVDEDSRGIFFICNPLTKTFIELPRILTNFDQLLVELPCMITDFDTVVTGMVVNKATKAYKVIVAGSNPEVEENGDPEANIGDADGCTVKAFLYDSSIPWAWKSCGSLVIEGQLTSRNAVCGGLLYCVTSRPFGLIAFDLAREVWLEVEVPMPRLLTCCFLTENEGNLMMIGGLGKFGVTTSIHVWQLSSTGPLWVKVDKMPRRLCKEFFRSSPSKFFTCIGGGNFLYFYCQKESRGVIYDCSRHSWHSVPPSPLLSSQPLQTAHGFCFNPRLDGSVDGRGFSVDEDGASSSRMMNQTACINRESDSLD